MAGCTPPDGPELDAVDAVVEGPFVAVTIGWAPDPEGGVGLVVVAAVTTPAVLSAPRGVVGAVGDPMRVDVGAADVGEPDVGEGSSATCDSGAVAEGSPRPGGSGSAATTCDDATVPVTAKVWV